LTALKGAMPGVRALLVVDRGGNVLEGHDTYYLKHAGDGNLVQDLNRMHDPGRIYLLQPKESALLAGDIYASMPVPDDRPSVERSLALHLDGQQVTFEVQYRQRHANGSWLWIHCRGKVVERGAGGEPLRMVGTRQDISLRKNAEAEIEHLAFTIA
jgi:PAS domain-containing protein